MKAQLNYCIIVTLISSIAYSAEKPNKKIAHYEKQQFAYLGSKIFQERHKLAAEWIGDCTTIIEIGGGQNSMSAHLPNAQKIIVIDPTIKNADNGRILHVAKKFEDWEVDQSLKKEPYAVIILGLALTNMPMHGWHKLYDLIDDSEKTVIEYSATFKPGKKQSKDILASVAKEKTAEKEFDFSQADEFKTEKHKNNINAYVRKMYLLEKVS